jgi:nucleoside-diphosphate-sugar epimerase
MGKKVLIIGGTRFFGKLLLRRLLKEGHQVTIATRRRAVDDFGGNVLRLHADRTDEAAMEAAFKGTAGFDLVFDQMCYTPLDAAISAKVFAGKVGRYVMSSCFSPPSFRCSSSLGPDP